MRERKRTPDRSNKPLRKPSDAIAAIGMPMGVPITMGSVDSCDWVRARGLVPGNHHWFVEVALSTHEVPVALWNDDLETRLHLYIYPAEWGYLFCHGGRGSWIRVADRAHVHGRDDFGLAGDTPPLREIGRLVRRLETTHVLQLRRDHVLVRTNLSDIEPCVRDWVLGL